MFDRKKLMICALLLALCILPMSGCADVSAAEPTPQMEAMPSPEPTPTPTPTPSPTPTPTPTAEPTTSNEIFDAYMGPDLPEREKVDDEFFTDALFVGNSLVHGLWGYGGIKTADYCAATSASVVNLDRVKNEAVWGEEGRELTLLETMSRGQYGKVYILLGINEIGFETPDFISIYSGVLDTVAALQPEAEIYIMGLTPVTEKKDAAGYPFTMERVLSYNEALRELAAEREYWYIDLVEALADETGFLPEAESTDGIHLIQEKYPAWAEYLRCHYAEN